MSVASQHPAANVRPAAAAQAQRATRRAFFDSNWIYLISVATMLLLWQFIAATFFRPEFFPTPLIVLRKGAELVADGSIFGHIGMSLARIMSGFAIGSLVAAPLGLLMGSFRPVRT